MLHYIFNDKRKKNIKNVIVLGNNGEVLSKTSPAKARKLLKKNKAIVKGYNPFTIKLIKKEEKMFISSKTQNDIINTEALCRVELNGKKVMFFYKTFSARDNWTFSSEEEAKETFEKIKKLVDVKEV
jgi:hypothetical protein